MPDRAVQVAGRAHVDPCRLLGVRQALLFELIDKLTRACPVQCHPFCKGVLIIPGCIVQMNQNGKLQRGKSRRLMHFRHRGDGDLVKTTPKSDGGLRSVIRYLLAQRIYGFSSS